ncbi:hypothetical protein FX988_00719 [Paraglaciecola mesophila]|uniref:Uncharacterized protein n=1 Tax=Paraglaciecola mesophila TaxID=197222 RepID=A0A857JEQ5_9ALTE|nr:hypothetical protein FX988_00719 [Paraglaciecola mesophila]
MNTKTNQSVNVGVDTGKFQLDIYIRPLDIYFTVSNDEKGIKEAIKIIKQHAPGLGALLLKQQAVLLIYPSLLPILFTLNALLGR